MTGRFLKAQRHFLNGILYRIRRDDFDFSSLCEFCSRPNGQAKPPVTSRTFHFTFMADLDCKTLNEWNGLQSQISSTCYARICVNRIEAPMDRPRNLNR